MRLQEHREILIFALIYFFVLNYSITERSMIWDEGGQNTPPAIFLVDFADWWFSNPTLNTGEIKNFALGYHSHYQVALNFLHHPPLTRVITALSFAVLGINEFAARFPTTLFAVLGVVATYFIAMKLYGGKEVALLAALILAISPRFFEYSRMAMMDVPLASMVALSFLAFLYLIENPCRKTALFFGISFGLAMLTKFPAIGAGIAIFMFLLLARKNIFDRFLIAGFIVALLIALPWALFTSLLPKLISMPLAIGGKYLDYATFSSPFLRGDATLLLSVLKVQFTLALVPVILLGTAYAIKRRETLLLSWIFVYFVFFIVVFYIGWAHTSRFLLVWMPAIAILTAKFLFDASARIKSIKPVVAVLLLAAVYLSIQQNVYATVELPFDEAATYLAKKEAGNNIGIIYTDMAVQFYFMKHDRNLSFYLYGIERFEDIDKLINSEYSDEANRALGIKNPKFKYVITYDSQREDEDVLGRWGEGFKGVGESLKKSRGFVLDRIFTGENGERVLIYKIAG